jgi:Ca2+/Na+ antiporter
MLSQPRTFRCPNCNEMINDSMTECPFCSVALDPGVVALIAGRQEKANRAYSDASFLRTAAVGMFVFLGISLIPLLGIVYWGFLFTFVGVLVLLIRWQVKFGSLITSDDDYRLAKRSKNVALILWLVAIPLGFIIRPLIDLLIAQLF